MMKFKQTEELSRTYRINLKDSKGHDRNLQIKAVWYDEEDEWVIEGSGVATYSQCELEEMLRIVTSLNKEKK